MIRYLIAFLILLYALTGARPQTPDFSEATLELLEEEEKVAITVCVPAGATLTLDFPHQDDYIRTNTDTEPKNYRVKIPWGVYYPNVPLDETQQVITPSVTVTTADGTVHTVDCPPFGLTFAALRIEYTSAGEERDGVFTAAADANGMYTLWGTVKSVIVCNGAHVFVNGEEVTLYEGGVFIAELSASDGEPATYEIVAEMDNFRTVRTTVVVLPFAALTPA